MVKSINIAKREAEDTKVKCFNLFTEANDASIKLY